MRDILLSIFINFLPNTSDCCAQFYYVCDIREIFMNIIPIIYNEAISFEKKRRTRFGSSCYILPHFSFCSLFTSPVN